MKAIKIISIIIGVLIALVLTLVIAGVFFTNRYLQTPAFKEQVLKAAREELGADVRIDDFKVSLFSGVELRGVTIGNPPGFTGNLLTAEAFILHYRLLPLLSRRVEIQQLSLDKPIITLSPKRQKRVELQCHRREGKCHQFGDLRGQIDTRNTNGNPDQIRDSASSRHRSLQARHYAGRGIAR